jgi:hypothetical protein
LLLGLKLPRKTETTKDGVQELEVATLAARNFFRPLNAHFWESESGLFPGRAALTASSCPRHDFWISLFCGGVSIFAR